MPARAAASIRGPETELMTELRKTGTHRVIRECMPLLGDKERVCQSIVPEGSAQGSIALELRDSGGMQRHKA
jgi:hypothetical protein